MILPNGRIRYPDSEGKCPTEEGTTAPPTTTGIATEGTTGVPNTTDDDNMTFTDVSTTAALDLATTTQAAAERERCFVFWRGRTCNKCGDRLEVESIWLVRGWTDDWRLPYDYALLILKRDQPSMNFLSFGYRSAHNNQGFDLFGYPGRRQRSIPGCMCRPM